jgi:CMP-N-acetylneuraminic acid synthetase
MINNKRVLALIPARGGSKGIKDKNIYPLCGKPLISYSIESAKNSKYIDVVVVSTDSIKIAEVAKEYGASVPFFRPARLASDTAKSIDAIIHAIKWLEKHGEKFDIFVLLQPTSPLRTSEDIDGALEKFIENGEKSLVAVSLVSDNPILMRIINADGTMEKLLDLQSTVRRQDMKSYYRVNGSIYINKISEINADTSLNDNEIPFVVKPENSVDIDEKKDLVLAEWYLGQKNE